MNKTFRILEILWLIMGGVGIVMCGYAITTSDRTGALYFLVFTIVCGLMYAYRKRQRINFEKTEELNKQHKEKNNQLK